MAKPTAFIVRPFGVKDDIDFDGVHAKLISPALAKAGIAGNTTESIFEAGNIRQDMFELLLTSDLVIADISIHNANVFYELGIRHALRDAHTILIRCRKDEVPFDLKTDRYIAYDLADLESGIESLRKSIEETLANEKPDSPVFRMLPGLIKQEPETFLAIPATFVGDLEKARNGDGGLLNLLSFEIRRFNFSWSLPALRLIGETQFQKGLESQGVETWNTLLTLKRGDIQAYSRLATIYQRLAESEMKRNPTLAKEIYAKSDNAIEFLINQKETLNSKDIAEACALKGRNEKGRWIASWIDEPKEEVAKKAISSVFLTNAFNSYLTGYEEDLNECYAGINALGLLKIIVDLAEREPDSWTNNYDEDDEASQALEGYKKEFEVLTVVMRKTLETNQSKLKLLGKKDLWHELTYAEFTLLTSRNPDRVVRRYQDAIEIAKQDNKEFYIYSSLRQVRIYEKLGIMPDNVAAVFNQYQEKEFDTRPDKQQVILFSGHMIDEAGRNEPRFPNELADAAKKEIRSKVQFIVSEEQKRASDEKPINFLGVAGGACGGDIIFHEVCKELGIPSKILLALPQQEFIAKSVSRGGNDWIGRFNALYNDPEVDFHILSETEEMPKWLGTQDKSYTFWQRNNLWTMYTAMAAGGRNISLLALWDGKAGDGPGGTNHMIEEIEKLGAKSIIINPRDLKAN